MVDWQSQETLEANLVSFNYFLHTIFGLYVWEWITTSSFDLQFILGMRPFRWPMVPYFYGRYAMLIGLAGFILALNVRDPIDCKALFIVLQFLGNTALGVATLNLAIRTMAIWGQRLTIVIPLTILLLGQFAIILRSVVNVDGVFQPGAGCVTTNVDSNIFAAMYIYTMAMDFIVLCLTAYRLIMDGSFRVGVGKRSPIVTLLFKDGLVYFIVAFGGNLIAVVFSLLKLNDVMALIADVPATTFATIVACRCVRRLNNFITGDSIHLFTASQSHYSPGPGYGGPHGPRVLTTGIKSEDLIRPSQFIRNPSDWSRGMTGSGDGSGVRIHMTTFTTREEDERMSQLEDGTPFTPTTPSKSPMDERKLEEEEDITQGMTENKPTAL